MREGRRIANDVGSGSDSDDRWILVIMAVTAITEFYSAFLEKDSYEMLPIRPHKITTKHEGFKALTEQRQS